jgi:hypothetical protein
MRRPELQRLIETAEAAIAASAAASADARRTGRAVLDRLREHEGEAGSVAPATLPVCAHLGTALSIAAGPRAEVAAALSAILPRLAWQRRIGADPSNMPFYDGHANAMLFGPDGLEERDDVRIGATLMAPHVVYVDHDHPPEEVYLPLTPGAWWNARMDWTDTGPQGLIYNPPGIRHAMRAGPSPFLALWSLPT